MPSIRFFAPRFKPATSKDSGFFARAGRKASRLCLFIFPLVGWQSAQKADLQSLHHDVAASNSQVSHSFFFFAAFDADALEEEEEGGVVVVVVDRSAG